MHVCGSATTAHTTDSQPVSSNPCRNTISLSGFTERFPDGESYEDVKARISDFLTFLKQHYNEKRVAIVAHKAPQLALDVLIKGKT